MKIEICRNREMVKDIVECNSSSGVVINYICIYMIKYEQLMGRRKSGVFLYKRYAAKTQNIINIISNGFVNLAFQ